MRSLGSEAVFGEPQTYGYAELQSSTKPVRDRLPCADSLLIT
jgi:hypothetical protein